MKDQHEFEYTFEEMREASLTHEERAEMRARVRLFMAEHPVKPKGFERLFGSTRAHKTGFSYMRPALAGFLMVVLIGGGTSYAAADALPGDLLYAIKTKVNEPVVSALALSEEAKASVSATFAVRRIEEAEVLASEGRLSSAARVELESKFEAHVADFDAKTTSLVEKEEGIEAVADAQSDLEVSLKVHAAVLAELSAALPDAEGELSPIQRKGEARVVAVENARANVEDLIATKIDGDFEKAATEKKRIVEREVSGRRTSGTVAAKAAPEAETMALMAVSAEDAATIDPTVEAFDAGSAALLGGQYGEAFTKFQGVIRTIKQEKIGEDVRKRLKFGGFDSKNEEEKNSNEGRGSVDDGLQHGGEGYQRDDDDNNGNEQEDKKGNDDKDGAPSDEDKSSFREATSSLKNILPDPLLKALPIRLGQ